MIVPHGNHPETTAIFPTPRLTTIATMSRFALLFLLLSVFCSPALSCSCIFSTFPRRYRTSPVVLKARVVSVKVVPPPSPPACLDAFPPCFPPEFGRSLSYTFRLLEVFKGCPPRATFFGRSADNSAACGVTLKKGRVYVLNLGMQKGTRKMPFGLSLCQGNVLFGKLSKGQKRFLKRRSMKKNNMCIK